MSDTLKFHIFGRTPTNPDGSPYGIKLETFLRAAKIKYDVIDMAEHQMKTTPKGKCPYVQRSDLNDGKNLGDSAIIMQALVEKGDAPDFDAWLSDTDKAVSTSFRALLEDNIYWYGLWVRWSTDMYWSITYPLFFKPIPWPMRPIIGYFARRDTMAQSHAQGSGRHSEAELIAFAKEKIGAVSTFLGDKKYMMGDKLSTLDFTAFGILSNHASGPWEHPIIDVVLNDRRLMDYISRIRNEFFPDFVAAAAEKGKAT
mmetsp:Transcript_68597/g.143099  ORF Transcript_68597/g.143099 Transcript_68597/m.143099 type:complete len:256 (+) Transcript_68597:88-855(+)